jgi:hypothetical protein
LKKVTSICLVVLILFNTLGFYGVLVGLRYKAKHDLVQRLDTDQYRYEETITLKVPLVIPYNTDDDDFERVDGEIEYEGEFYRLVKQKLVRDTLHIVCLKDVKSKNIKKALADYVKTFTDKPSHGKTKGKIQISFIKDYLQSSFSISHGSEGWDRSVRNNHRLDSFCSVTIAVFGPPPRA